MKLSANTMLAWKKQILKFTSKWIANRTSHLQSCGKLNVTEHLLEVFHLFLKPINEEVLITSEIKWTFCLSLWLSLIFLWRWHSLFINQWGVGMCKLFKQRPNFSKYSWATNIWITNLKMCKTLCVICFKLNNKHKIF